MKLTSRRFALFAAGGLLAAVVPASIPAATAATASLAYTCPIAGNNLPVAVVADTNAPPALKPGATYAPTLKSTMTFSAAVMDGFRSNGIKTIGASGKANITTTINANPASSTPVNVAFPVTNIPASGGLTVNAVGTMAQIPNAVEQTVTYKPGSYTLTFALGGFNTASTCTTPANAAVIDTVTIANDAPVVQPPVVKVATKTFVAKSYKKSKDRLTIKTEVKPASGSVTQTGMVKFVLTKAGKVKKSKFVTLSAGKASVLFKKVRKGSKYKITVTYYGSAKSLASSVTTKSFKLK